MSTPSSASSAGGSGKGGGRRGAGRSRTSQPKEEQPGQQKQSQVVPEQQPTAAVGEAGQRILPRGRRGVDDESPPGGSPQSESPSRASPDNGAEDVEAKMKNLALIDFVNRPGFGTSGRKTMVLANHYEILIPKELIVFQYHVDIAHLRMKLNRDEKRLIFWQCIAENGQTFASPYKILFDGDHICITQSALKFPKKTGENGDFTFQVSIRLPRMENRPDTFNVTFQLVGSIFVNMRDVQTASISKDRSTTPLTVLDILFRQNRTCTKVPFSKNWYPFGSTVYRIPSAQEIAPLGFGQVIWQGLFASARIGQEFRPFVNFDISHSSFYTSGQAIFYMIDVLNSTFGGGFHISQLNAGTMLGPMHVQALNKAFKGLTIVSEVKPLSGEKYEREYRVNGVIAANALTQTFEYRKDETVRTVTIADYFKERYGDLKFPRLQLLSVGPQKRGAFLPIERCMIKSCQRVTKKLMPAQLADMIKATAIDAPNRKRKVDQLVQAAALPQDPWLQAYGVQVSQQMTQVEARVLQPPRIEYARGSFSNVDASKGSWDQRQKQYFMAAGTQKIGAIIIEDGRDRDGKLYRDFFGFLLTTCREFGMQMPQSINDRNVHIIPTANAETELERKLKAFADMGADLVFVALPQKGSPLYATTKRIAEVTCGVMTQCVTKPTIQKTITKNDRMTTGNIALKVNAKLGGISWKGEAEANARKILEEKPTVVLGVDVTHPGPLEKRAPSVSAVVGNIDSSFMRYGASVQVQKHRREHIVYLQDPMRERLIDYLKRGAQYNNERASARLPPLPHGKPQRIIVYRDGVAEGQFQDVVGTELKSLRDACETLGGGDYKPSITFIVAQKRHHTRFFPMSDQDSCGRSKNIFMGTVVEKVITHPKMFEFYLCSHYGIQGTSRPIRYHVLTDDNNLTADNLQNITFFLTHCFARCTRPVSLVAPQYYADLACRRARIHLQEKVSDFSSETMSQSGTGEEGTSTGITEQEMIRGSTVTSNIKLKMYFT